MGANRLTWLGHSTVLVEVGGARLLTDPLLRARIGPLRRHPPPPAAPGRLDGVLVSHAHLDHLDLPSLRALDPAAPVVVPRGASRMLRRLDRDVRELAPGEELVLGPARVRAVPAVHDGRRWPLLAPAATLGYVVEGGGRRPDGAGLRVYFAGDTELFAGMADLAAGLDAALLPIWGWGSTLGPGHMDPSQAARALTLLRPALAVPIHWGTLLPLGLARRRASVLREPARTFAALAAATVPDVRIAVLDPGGSVALG